MTKYYVYLNKINFLNLFFWGGNHVTISVSFLSIIHAIFLMNNTRVISNKYFLIFSLESIEQRIWI